MTLPAIVDSVAQARHAVVRHLDARGVDPLAIEHVALAVSEACTNVVLHAYRSSPSGDLQLELAQRNTLLHVWVTDFGVGLRPRLDSPGMGIGLQVIGSLAETLTIISEGSGTTLQMVFTLDGPGG